MRPENRAFDSLHLNRNGYKLLAVDIFNALKPMAINVEWNTWKSALKGSLPEHEEEIKKDRAEFDLKAKKKQ